VRSELLTETAVWRRLGWHVAELRGFELREAFESDPTRGTRLAAEAAGVYLDYSKNLVTDDTLQLLRRLAHERGLEERIRRLVGGGRATDGELERMLAFALDVRAGTWLGATGEPVRAVVVLGAEPGAQLAYEALRERAGPELAFRFVSSADPVELARATRGLDPRETLYLVSTTQATRRTAAGRAVRARVGAALGGDSAVGRHLVAVADDPDDTAEALGIPREQVFSHPATERLSSRSAAGLSTAIALGDEAVHELLGGFRAMDEHFARAPLGGNVPAIAGLLAVWYRSFLGAATSAVLPYTSALRLVPAYVEHLSLPALGRSARESGEPAGSGTGAVVWGATGDEQVSAALRFLHRGTSLVPADLVAVARSPEPDAREQHDLVAAGAIAQAQRLARGQTVDDLEKAGVAEDAIPDLVLPGNRPTSVLLLRDLSPATLGALLALYEHSVFTQAAIWDLDPFDPWDLESAEALTARIAAELSPGWKHELLHDSSTNALIERYRQLRDGGT